MVTVVDPTGTPVPVYNRSGMTITEVTTVSMSNPPIEMISGHTIVLVTVPAMTSTTLFLPNDAEIGDVVEVYWVDGEHSLSVEAQMGEAIGRGPSGDIYDRGRGIFRKITATLWGVIS